VKVRVISATNFTKDSNEFRVNVQQGVGAAPAAIKGRVLASVSLRSGPGEQFQAVGTLPGETEVTILGKTRDSEWLLVQYQGQERWVKRQAIEPSESLALVPTREPTPIPQPTPTPQATATPTGSATPSVSPSATANANAPDFVPVDAQLIDGGTVLRVRVANQSPNAFTGSLVLSVTGVGASATRAFAVTLAANGSTTVDFELSPAVTGGATAQITVDPDNAVRERSEDNNVATFVLAAAAEDPEIVMLAPQVLPAAIRVTIRNDGGELKASDVTIQVAVGGQNFSKTERLALAKGQSVTIEVTRPPGTGQATVSLLINGTVTQQTQVTLQ
jgi:uncharacterized protein YgiM (DUF1202 family)